MDLIMKEPTASFPQRHENDHIAEVSKKGDTIYRAAAIDRAVPLEVFGRTVMIVAVSEIERLPSVQPEILACGHGELVQDGSRLVQDTISRQAAIDALWNEREKLNAFMDECLKNGNTALRAGTKAERNRIEEDIYILKQLPSAQPEQSIRCRDCKYWRQQTNYQGALLSFGFCESDDMWRSLYGETYEVAHIDTDDDFYCGYAERRTDEAD